jgi:E3 ubiquitin-protein ligase HUWE1
MIHGAEVDITETGIDPEFLEALPEDMRADVVAQHLRESRAAAAQTQPAASTEISPEFLDALPPDIRAEVIQQEAIEAARRNAESRSTAASAGHGSQVAELGDYQGFLNTLDPAIRQVLQDQEGGFLAGLPSHFVPSALSRQMATGTRRLGSSTRPHDDPVASHNALANPQPAIPKKAPPRETIQLLDKSGIAALIRLLFFPGISKKNNLLKVLANLCENTKGRGDVINLLLGVLQDDSGDLSYVDRQTASRLTKGVAGTPKATPKKKPTPDTPSSSAVMLSQMQSESVPTFVAQRAFEALVHIVNSNEQALAYFLTEQEIFSATKSNTKKGKGREKPVFQTYPIVVLLKLLDRPSLFRTPGMVETLTALLSTLTKPLAHLPKASKVSLEDVPTTGSDPEGDSIAIADLAEPAATGPASGSIPAVQPAGADSAAVQPSDIDTERETTDSLIKTPPVIPDEILRLVPNVLTHGECSSRTFSSTLGMIQNLTFIPSAKETISAQLQDHAQRLGDGLNADLAQLQVDLLQAETSATEREVPVGRFSPASSSQTKLLRVLKTIDYIHSPKDGVNPSSWDAAAITSVAEGTKELTAEEERAEHIFDSMHFAPLWEALGQCLTVIERKEFLMPIATVLLPLVESLMVVSKYGSAKAAATRGRTGSAAMSPMSPKDLPEEEPFVAFTSRHRKILNTMVRNNPSLMSGSFSLLILNPRVLEFDNKRNWFMQQLRKKPNRDVGGNIHLNVRRQYVFDDSYRALQNKSGESLKYGKLNVKFYDEEGVDAGGVTREWYSVLAQSIFNPGYCK